MFEVGDVVVVLDIEKILAKAGRKADHNKEAVAAKGKIRKISNYFDHHEQRIYQLEGVENSWFNEKWLKKASFKNVLCDLSKKIGGMV